MAQFNLQEYETVASRLERFWDEHPEGAIITDIYELTEKRGIFKATVFFNKDDVAPVAVDFAEEIKDSSPVNKTSWVENGLTSAIGRALADCGYAPKASTGGKRPSREEMQKVQRLSAPKPVAKSLEDPTLLQEVEALSTKDDAREMYLRLEKTASKAVLDAITKKAHTLP